jgi:hypothetical protein
VLLLLVLDRDSLRQDVVDEPLQVRVVGPNDNLLEVFEFWLKVILAGVVADELDGLLIILGRHVFLNFFN